MSAIFISHSSNDSESAQAVVEILEAANLSCWIAPRDIPRGADYAGEISKAIERCETLVLLLSDDSNRSEDVRREVHLATNSRKRIVTIRLEDVEPSSSLKYYISDLQYEDALSSVEESAQAIVDAVKTGRGTPAPPRKRFRLARNAVLALVAAASLATIAYMWPDSEPTSQVLADFEVTSDIRGIAPLTVKFRSRSENDPTSLRWSFGDGSPAVTTKTSEVEHEYTMPGKFDVTLNASKKGSSNRVVYKALVEVVAPLKADFTATPREGLGPLTVKFTDTSSGAVTDRHWDFGDGTTADSKSASVTHKYARPGSYDVRLIADRHIGGTELVEAADTLVQEDFIVVAERAAAAFSLDPLTGRAPLLVRATNKSSVGNYTWEFGDGEPNSFDREPAHVFQRPGIYTVKLTVTGAGEGNSAARSAVVKVAKSGVAKFAAATKVTGDAPFEVKFRDGSEGAQEWTWDFGDGKQSIDQHPGHVYKEPGRYDVVLRIKTASGDSHQTKAAKLVRIHAKPSVTLSPTSATVANGGSVRFSYSILGDVKSATIDWGDGTRGAIRPGQATARHAYRSPGTKTVVLRAVGQSGASFEKRASVVVKPRRKTPKIVWSSGFLKPRRTRGDNEFEGHGPKMTASAKVFVSSDKRSVLVSIAFSATETKSNFSTATGKWQLIAFRAPAGWKIESLSPRSPSATVSITSTSKKDIPLPARSIGKFTLRGDRRGSDIGSWTAVQLTIDQVKVNLVEVPLITRILKPKFKIR